MRLFSELAWSARLGLFLLSIVSVTLLLTACGSQNEQVYRLGIYVNTPQLERRLDGLRDGLQAFGYVEGRNLQIIRLKGDGLNADQFNGALRDFAAQNYDVYWTSAGASGQQFQKAGITSRPIIVAGLSDPVMRGLVKSEEEPGSNLTGVDSYSTQLTIKRLGWLHKLAPDLKNVYLLYDPTNQSEVTYVPGLKTEASQLGMNLIEKKVSTAEESRTVATNLKAQEAGAILTVGNITLNQIVDSKALQAAIDREKLILVGPDRSYLSIDALFSYGIDSYAIGRQSAFYVVRSLRGTSPAQLPILHPDTLQLVLNQKLADSWGQKFPQLMLDAADDIVGN